MKGKVENVVRGEIYMANIPKEAGSIQYGFKPVIILSNNACNQHSSVITAYVITSKQHKSKIPTHVDIGLESGLKLPSVVLCEQPRSISKDILAYKVGNCDNRTMSKINLATLIQFGINVQQSNTRQLTYA